MKTQEKLEQFFEDMWDMFVDGGNIDGLDLQEALERSGLCEWREATGEEAEESSYDLEEGDPLLCLNEEGCGVSERARQRTVRGRS